MSDELIELPEGWVWIFFEDITVNNDGKRVPVSSLERKHRQGSFPYYGASGIIDYVDNYLFDGRYLLIAEDGANLLSRTTPIAFEANGKFWVNNHAHVVQVIEGLVLYSYLRYYINSTDLRFYISGSAQPKLNQKNLNCIPIPLPPLNEQKRIVAKIEELNDRTQRAKEALETIPQLCDRFRQSVLAAAFRGDLTADWREQNPDVEPASVLLERIRAERHERYKNECNKAEAEGRKKPALFKENLEQIEISSLPTIPDIWSWTRLVNISNIIGGVTKGRKFGNCKTIMLPYLRVANVQDGYLDLNEIKEIEVLPEDLEKYHLEYGDILFTEGGDRDKLGRGTIWIDNIKNCIHQNHVYRARLYYSGVSCNYISLVTKSKYAKAYFFGNASQTVNLASINLTCLGNLPLPIPSAEEQKEIVYRVQHLFKAADTIEQQYQKAKVQLNRLNQSILAKAFRGELVPQDPDDEPASVLLERIRAEREKLNNGKQKSQRTSKRKSKTVEEEGV